MKSTTVSFHFCLLVPQELQNELDQMGVAFNSNPEKKNKLKGASEEDIINVNIFYHK